ncbi:CDP-alcohol phosphatidyltransferase family protein, partial [Coprobacillus cateniformis]|nr:CDP-alcohol phosphatidyltransferase family protein [Coprobacillus cateniformis]
AFYIPGTMISTVMIYSTVVLMIIAMIYYSQGLYRLYKEN